MRRHPCGSRNLGAGPCSHALTGAVTQGQTQLHQTIPAYPTPAPLSTSPKSTFFLSRRMVPHPDLPRPRQVWVGHDLPGHVSAEIMSSCAPGPVRPAESGLQVQGFQLALEGLALEAQQAGGAAVVYSCRRLDDGSVIAARRAGM